MLGDPAPAHVLHVVLCASSRFVLVIVKTSVEAIGGRFTAGKENYVERMLPDVGERARFISLWTLSLGIRSGLTLP
jgi:hypothetical protein